jgi:hypothetical protein
MCKFLILISVMASLVATFFSRASMNGYTARQAEAITPIANTAQIKGASLLLVAEEIKPTGVTLSLSMASFVKYQGQVYLVTHNHFGSALQDMNIFELRDPDNHLIRTIYGSEFKSLIIYQDAGTMILHAPEGLENDLVPGSVNSSSKLEQGDIVQVAYRQQPDRTEVTVEEAVIAEIDYSHPAPAYKLRRLSGEPLLPGDSGGGVWHDGNLVGNTWSILTDQTIVPVTGGEVSTREDPTVWSYAAILPDALR